MLNYANPLDQFRSHSYHFVLTVSSSTEAFRKMLDKDGFFSAVNSTQLGEKINLPDGERCYLLADTRRYSQFTIPSLELTQAYGAGNLENPSVPISEIKMKLVDSTGLTFFNFLMDTLSTKVQSTKGSAFYMLSILFTGHDDANPQGTYTIPITCHIPMIMSQMGFEFSSSGTNFDIEFLEIEGNPGAGLPHITDLDIQTVSTESKANTVGGMVQALEDLLNLQSLRFFHKYTNDALSSTGQSENAGQFGKLVQYMFSLPKEWENFKLDTATKSENREQYFVKKAKAAQAKTDEAVKEINRAAANGQISQEDAAKMRSSYQSFASTSSIQDALTVILNSSQEYLDLASEKKLREGKAIVPRIVVNTTSDATTYIVHVDVYPYEAVKMKAKNGAVETNNLDFVMSNGRIRNLMVYDYMFTGKNSHVLDLKVEFAPFAAAGAIQTGLNLGQSRMTENTNAGQSEKKMQQQSDNGLHQTKHYNPYMLAGEPLFPPTRTKDEQKGFANISNSEYGKTEALNHIKARQEHTNTLASLHFLQSFQAQMTIRGNPNLLCKNYDRQTRGGVPKHTLAMKAADLNGLRTETAETFFSNSVRNKVSSGKAQYIAEYIKPRLDKKPKGSNDEVLSGPDLFVAPLFAQVNIKAPNVDFLGNTIPGDSQFTNKFFYNDIYQVPIISHVFDGGNFKQVLTLLPWNPNFIDKPTQGIKKEV